MCGGGWSFHLYISSSSSSCSRFFVSIYFCHPAPKEELYLFINKWKEREDLHNFLDNECWKYRKKNLLFLFIYFSFGKSNYHKMWKTHKNIREKYYFTILTYNISFSFCFLHSLSLFLFLFYLIQIMQEWFVSQSIKNV